MVIRCPMSQLGWLEACCRRRGGQPLHRPVAERPARGGDDDAARPPRCPRPPGPGRSPNVRCPRAGSWRRVARAVGHQQRPGRDEAFLVGQRQRAALRRSAASPGTSPAAPTMADIVQSAGRAAASAMRVRPGGRLGRRCPPARSLSVGQQSSDRQSPPARRRSARGHLGQPRDVAAAGQRDDLVTRRPRPRGSIRSTRVLADRAGRAEDRDAAHRSALDHRQRRTTSADAAAAQRSAPEQRVEAVEQHRHGRGSGWSCP